MEIEDKRGKVDTFLAITGTEDAAAAEAMLDGNGWNVEGAIDFFFATGTTGAVDSGGGAGVGGTGGAPALGLRGMGGMEDNLGDDAATAVSRVEDEDAELQRAIAASMDPVASVHPSQAFQPPPFPPPASQFRPPSDPIPPHLRSGGGGDSDEKETLDNLKLPRRLQLSATQQRDEAASDASRDAAINASMSAALSQEMMQAAMMGIGLPHGMGMRGGMGGGMPGVGGGMGGGGGGDDATDAAFLEAAMQESLDAAQPAMADEDDPLLAEAIHASLLEAGGDAAAATEGASASAMQDTRSMIERFPALKAQLEAEQRAAAGEVGGVSVGGDAALAAAMAAAMGYDFDGAARAWQAPAPPSPGTLEARRVRQEQDTAYQEALEMDQMRELSKQQAQDEARAAEARAMADSHAVAKAEEDAAAKAAAELATLKAEIPPEPPAGDGVCTVVVRLQDGSRLAPRRFRDTDTIRHVYAHVTVGMHEKDLAASGACGGFELVSNMPMRSFKDKTQSLAEAGLQGQTLLIAQPVE